MRNQLVLVITGFILLGGLILTAPAAGSSTRAAKATKLTVAMRDPGCHWFMTGSSPHRMYSKTAVRPGAVNLVNLDEATLIIKGPGGTRHEKVGATMTLNAKGLYRITMVKQMPDDNHLKLTIK
jgi:hypothetical protein